MATTNPDIEYDETSSFPPDEFDPRFVKVRITTMLDQDVLHALKRIAEDKGTKYQTLLNFIVREYVERAEKTEPLLTEGKLREILREELQRAQA